MAPLTQEEKDKIKEYKKAGQEKQLNTALEHDLPEDEEINVENIPF
ncbi:hypothetical protein BROC_01322 [Candidatus Brocadiaceae bacterium]|nr:hypothetical protein BROC_01322 [Candidatus Brocadiaceae bacterium]